MSPVLMGVDRLPPREALSLTYYWADYVELLCLVSPDREVSPDLLMERWKGQDDLWTLETADVDDDPIEPELPPGATKAAVDDQRYRRTGDIFEHLAFRSGAFESDYPFEYRSGALTSLVRRDELSDRHKLYIFLLLGSLLRYIPATRRGDITTAFERFAAELMRHWLPVGAEVHIYGTAAEAGSRYAGTPWQRLSRLGADLGEVVLLNEDDFLARDRGDLGLDIVAWLPVGDSNAGLPVFFGQATCELRWKDKQHESGKNWQAYLKESAPRGNVLFVPHCFRRPDGAWFDRKWPTAAVIIDRLRACRLLRDLDGPLNAIPYELVEEALTVLADP